MDSTSLPSRRSIMKRIKVKTKRSIQSAAYIALLCAPAITHAFECTSDADCAQGEHCELFEVFESICEIDEEGDEICIEGEGEDSGICVEDPIECETNSDCPGHLTCVQSGGVSIGSSDGSDGASDAEPAPPPGEGMEMPEQDLPPPDPAPIAEEPSMCVFIQAQCETDDECGSNFHCELETYEVGCTEPAIGEIDCGEEEDCLPPEPEVESCENEVFTEGFCVPDEIDCGGGEMCPDDWRCQEVVEFECDDVTEVALPPEGEGAEAPEMGDVPETEIEIEPVDSCEEVTRSLCVPVGLDLGYGTTQPIPVDGEGRNPGVDPEVDPEVEPEVDPEGDPTDNPDAGNEPPTPADEGTDIIEEGGCDASSRQSTPWALFGLFALLGLRRRAGVHGH
jgi:MYXO-CTERM domain-containing protein